MNKQELNNLLKASDSNDPEAQFEVGRMYIDGAYIKGIVGSVLKQNLEKGLSLIRKSASREFEPAVAYLHKKEQGLKEMIKRRKMNEKLESLAPYFLLGFVVVLIFSGIIVGIITKWSGTFWVSVVAIIASTSSFWAFALPQIIKEYSRKQHQMNLTQDRKPTYNLERILVFFFGLVFISILILLAIYFPNPTAFQYTVFRIVLSLASAGIAAFIPGFLNIKINNWLRAGGAMAVFAIVYFFTPASLILK